MQFNLIAIHPLCLIIPSMGKSLLEIARLILWRCQALLSKWSLLLVSTLSIRSRGTNDIATRDPSINLEIGTGDKAGIITGKEEGRLGLLDRLPESSHRDMNHSTLLLLGRVEEIHE